MMPMEVTPPLSPLILRGDVERKSPYLKGDKERILA